MEEMIDEILEAGQVWSARRTVYTVLILGYSAASRELSFVPIDHHIRTAVGIAESIRGSTGRLTISGEIYMRIL